MRDKDTDESALAKLLRQQEGHRVEPGSIKNIANGNRRAGFDLAFLLARVTGLAPEQIRQPPKPRRRRAPAAPMGLAAAGGAA